jgi:hypothetical protein
MPVSAVSEPTTGVLLDLAQATQRVQVVARHGQLQREQLQG